MSLTYFCTIHFYNHDRLFTCLASTSDSLYINLEAHPFLYHFSEDCQKFFADWSQGLQPDGDKWECVNRSPNYEDIPYSRQREREIANEFACRRIESVFDSTP